MDFSPELFGQLPHMRRGQHGNWGLQAALGPASTGTGACVSPPALSSKGAPWDRGRESRSPPPQGLGSKPLLPNWPAGSSVSHRRPQPSWAGCLRTHGHPAALGPPPGLPLWEKTADSANPARSAGGGTPRTPLACRNRVTSSPPVLSQWLTWRDSAVMVLQAFTLLLLSVPRQGTAVQPCWGTGPPAWSQRRPSPVG